MVMTGSGSERSLNMSGPIEDEIACSNDHVLSMSNTSLCPTDPGNHYYLAYCTTKKVCLSVFGFIPSGGL